MLIGSLGRFGVSEHPTSTGSRFSAAVTDRTLPHGTVFASGLGHLPHGRPGFSRTPTCMRQVVARRRSHSWGAAVGGLERMCVGADNRSSRRMAVEQIAETGESYGICWTPWACFERAPVVAHVFQPFAPSLR